MRSAQIDRFQQLDHFVQLHFVRAHGADPLQPPERTVDAGSGDFFLPLQFVDLVLQFPDLVLQFPDFLIVPGGRAVAVQQLVEQRARLTLRRRLAERDQLVCADPEIVGGVGESRTGRLDCVGHT